MSERPKTLQHMQQLMALAALTSCKRDAATADAAPTTTTSTTPTVVNTTPEPAPDAAAMVLDSGVAQDAALDAKKEGGIKVEGVDIVHSAQPKPTYHVVDMLPPPPTITPRK